MPLNFRYRDQICHKMSHSSPSHPFSRIPSDVVHSIIFQYYILKMAPTTTKNTSTVSILRYALWGPPMEKKNTEPGVAAVDDENDDERSEGENQHHLHEESDTDYSFSTRMPPTGNSDYHTTKYLNDSEFRHHPIYWSINDWYFVSIFVKCWDFRGMVPLYKYAFRTYMIDPHFDAMLETSNDSNGLLLGGISVSRFLASLFSMWWKRSKYALNAANILHAVTKIRLDVLKGKGSRRKTWQEHAFASFRAQHLHMELPVSDRDVSGSRGSIFRTLSAVESLQLYLYKSRSPRFEDFAHLKAITKLYINGYTGQVNMLDLLNLRDCLETLIIEHAVLRGFSPTLLRIFSKLRQLELGDCALSQERYTTGLRRRDIDVGTMTFALLHEDGETGSPRLPEMPETVWNALIDKCLESPHHSIVENASLDIDGI